MKPMNKKGLAFAAVVLLLAAALFVGAAAAGDAAGGDGPDTEKVNYVTVTIGETKYTYDTIALAAAAHGDSGTTYVIHGTLTYDMPSKGSGSYTFEGAEGETNPPTINLPNPTGYTQSGMSLTFSNLKLIFPNNGEYRGFMHSSKEEYINCTIEGFFKTYAPTVIFNGCTFDQETYEYHFWVYGKSTATFTGCTFNNLGKAAKIYNEGDGPLDVTFKDCTFNATIPTGEKGKAAIEINSDSMEAKVTIEGCTVNGFAKGAVSGNTFWNNEPDKGDASQKATVSFPVHFDAGDGMVSPESKFIEFDATSDGKVVKNETKYGTLPTPTKAGASFDGWYTAATGGELVTAATVIKPEDAVEHTLYAHWSAPVAKIGTTTYGSLAEAVADVPAGKETTITMIADHTIIGNTGVTIPAGREIILDLNGHTVQNVVGEEKASQIIDNQGTLTIKDSTDKKKDGTGKGKLMNVVEKGIQPGDWDQWNYATNVILNQGILTVESGLLEQTAGGTICYAIDANSSANPVSTTIKGGNMISVKTAVRMFSNSSTNDNIMVVEGGTITSKEKYGLVFQNANKDYANKGSLTIKGGTVNGGVESGTEYESLNVWAETGSKTDNMSVDITGGVFTTKVTIDEVAPKTLSVSGGHFKQITVDSTTPAVGFITGGIFDTKPDASYIATDYEWNTETREVVMFKTESKTPGTDELPEKEVDGKTKVQMSGLPDEVASVKLAATNLEVEDKQKAEKTYETVYITLVNEQDVPVKNKSATVVIKVKLEGVTSKNGLGILHGVMAGNKLVWKNDVTNLKIEGLDSEGFFTFTFTAPSFSPFAVVKVAQTAPSKSSTPQGSSVWLTDDTPAEPKVTPTPTPTPGPVETPSVKPVTPTETPAKTPAPFLGILAGLGAAAVLFGLRRK